MSATIIKLSRLLVRFPRDCISRW